MTNNFNGNNIGSVNNYENGRHYNTEINDSNIANINIGDHYGEQKVSFDNNEKENTNNAKKKIKFLKKLFSKLFGD